MQQRVLDNGLKVIAESLPGRRKVQLHIGIFAGAMDEPSEKKGGLHLLEHMQYSSNGGQTAREFVEAVEFKGGTTNAYTSPTETSVGFWVRSARLYDTLDIAVQALINRDYNVEEFEREKEGVVKTELVTYERVSPTRFFDRILYPQTFRGTPLQEDTIGTLASVRSLTLDDILDLKDRLYVPNNMFVLAVGGLDEEEFIMEVEKRFDSMQPKSVEHPRFSWTLEPREMYSEMFDLKDPYDSDQDAAFAYLVYQVNPVSSPDEAGIYFLNTLIGEGQSSLLFQELRQDRGIGYDLGSHYVSMNGHGALVCGVPFVDPTRIEETVDGITDIIKRLSREPVPERIFEGNKEKYLSKFEDILDETQLLAGERLARTFLGAYLDVMEVPAAIEKLTRGELFDVARRNLSGDPLLVIASAAGYSNRYSHLAPKTAL